MDAYVYQSALYCADCAPSLMDSARAAGADHTAEDSNTYPQGPYADGGGESDTPQHCDACNTFLDNPLTGDGETYVRDAFREFVDTGRGNPDVLGEWKTAYDWLWSDFADITFAGMTEDGNVGDLQQRRFDDLEAR